MLGYGPSFDGLRFEAQNSESGREEQFCVGRRRHSGIVKLKTGVKKNGTFTARQMFGILGKGAYSSHGYGVIATSGCSDVQDAEYL